jgi:hypothetical protein
MGNFISNKIFFNYYVQLFILNMNQIFVHVVLISFIDPLDISYSFFPIVMFLKIVQLRG